jgi:hypothetical protein
VRRDCVLILSVEKRHALLTGNGISVLFFSLLAGWCHSKEVWQSEVLARSFVSSGQGNISHEYIVIDDRV